VFLAYTMLLGLKKQPNRKTYWAKVGSFFHCPLISSIFTRARFQTITNCLHITNPADYVHEKGALGYDKMGQVRWLATAIYDAFKREWELGKYVTVDEMMIGYKGSYCPATQYMPKKPQKWGIKVWCLSDTKYVYDFDIYYGRNGNGAEQPKNVPPTEGSVATNVVLNLVNGLEGRGHVVVTDNYFTSVGLFTEFASGEIYATGTVQSNRVGVPRPFNNLRNWRDSEQGTLDWHTHSSRGISCVVWKDKRPVHLLSTSTVHVQLPCIAPSSIATVPRRNGAIREQIQTSPVHLEYTTFMRGVDVADQLRASYSCQSCSHKWWHRAFHFLLDQTIVNMYTIYFGLCGSAQHRRKSMTHLQFKMQICEALLQGWWERDRHVH
jgi:hypothetical protein